MTNIEDYGYIDFKTIKEGHSEFLLEDGTIIRARVFLLKVIKDGPDLSFNEKTFGVAFSPSNLKGPHGAEEFSIEDIENIKKSIKKFDVNIIIEKGFWNEYELSTGDKFYNKVVLVSTSLTDKFDKIGDPIYTIQLQVLHKIMPPEEKNNSKG